MTEHEATASTDAVEWTEPESELSKGLKEVEANPTTFDLRFSEAAAVRELTPDQVAGNSTLTPEQREAARVIFARIKLASWAADELEGNGHVVWPDPQRASISLDEDQTPCACDRCQAARLAFATREEWQLVRSFTSG